MGLLIFCAQVIPVSGLYLRSAFAVMKEGGTWFSVGRKLALDLAWWGKVLSSCEGAKRTLDRKQVLPVYFTLDASTDVGMGGFLEGKWFAVTWKEIRRMQQKPVYPFGTLESSHINYLELFAVYWALVVWGRLLRGCAVPIRTDSTTVEAMLRKWWGQATFIPLLKEIFILCVKWDVELVPSYINTKVNVLSDSLSRQQWDIFWVALAEWRVLRRTSRDDDDWRLMDQVFEGLDREFGPFKRDACCDVMGANRHLEAHWTWEDDARTTDWDAETSYCNPPFSIILQILLRFLICKERCQVGTSAVFVLPMWVGEDFLELVESMPNTFVRVRDFPAGSELFTAPVWGSVQRRYCGVTRWDVGVFRVPPAPMVESVDWGRWGRFVFTG